MILGIDTGLATFGWALLDDTACSFVDLGVVITKPVEGDRAVTLDRAARANAQAVVIAERAKGCHTIVVERMSFPPGGANALVPIALSWGVAIGVIATLAPRPRLLTIAPQRWQREVLPNAGKQVDYDELAHNAATYLLANHPRASEKLRAIKKVDRNHAIDAAMLALVGALMPAKCERIEAPAS
ncbi:MAG TPA: hypothetical protein VGG74_21180 [Kofleriaceae bacterium]|jgi:hypothetical protein